MPLRYDNTLPLREEDRSAPQNSDGSGSALKPGLAIDTSFSSHQGTPPKQLFPKAGRKHELSFFSIRDAKCARDAKNSQSKGVLEKRLGAGPTSQPTTSSRGDDDFAPPAFMIPSNKRAKGLRPPPLDLHSAISPSDRAITIALDVPGTSSGQATDRKAATAQQQSSRLRQEPITPSIIITPAGEDFAPAPSPGRAKRSSNYRPPSSVYSRYTTCYPTTKDTPPVPPLPTIIQKNLPRESTATIFEEQDSPPASHGLGLDVNSNKEIEIRDTRRLTSQSHLPTPERSKGWWNVITSPFSGTRSGAFFWRSPSIPEEEDDALPILRDPSLLETSEHDGVIFTNRSPGDDELRSAPVSAGTSFEPPKLRRSDTAPSYVRPTLTPVDIYRVPSQGEAASYYDSLRHFPSADLSNDNFARSAPDDWSPSHSVYRGDAEHFPLERNISSSTRLGSESDLASPFDDCHAISDARRQPTVAQAVFSTPSEEEMYGHSPAPEALTHPPARQSTYGVVESHFSPMTATPIIEDAHIGLFMGPASATDLREIDLGPQRMRSPTVGPGLGEATMAHRWEPEPSGIDHNRYMAESQHSRNGSYGLGISDEDLPRAREADDMEEKDFGKMEKEEFEMGRSVDLNHEEDGSFQQPWYRRFLWLFIAIPAILLILTVVLCVTLITQKHQDMPVEAQWLNTSGFPPLPTGIMTVNKPNVAKVQTGCVSPQALWTCAAPSNQQSGGGTNTSVPNFRFEIRFRNGTLPSNETSLGYYNSSGPAARVRSVLRRNFWEDSLYQANPAPPSEQDQEFMGGTTDNVTQPYNGEETPFYISFVDAVHLGEMQNSKTRKRDDQNPFPLPGTQPNISSSSKVSTQAMTSVPEPALQPNGQPTDPALYPYAYAQPLRLYNRGQDSEHFGFYVYFDKSLYISNLTGGTLGDGITTNTAMPNASAVCTWSQTRFLVQIWTRKPTISALDEVIPLNGLPAINSTANDLSGSGSFPYRTTVTLDRHGGDSGKKGVYCYGLDDNHNVVKTANMWVPENRGSQGLLVNPASVPGANHTQDNNRRQDRGQDNNGGGGIDGGTGGCGCVWQNWI